jgi:hypothetical protein
MTNIYYLVYVTEAKPRGLGYEHFSLVFFSEPFAG